MLTLMTDFFHNSYILLHDKEITQTGCVGGHVTS